MEIIPWEAPYFRHSKDIQAAAWSHKNLIAKMFDGNPMKMKVTSLFQAIKNKKQCFQLVSDQTKSLVLRARFFVSDRALKENGAPEKFWYDEIKFVLTWLRLTVKLLKAYRIENKAP